MTFATVSIDSFKNKLNLWHYFGGLTLIFEQ
jgi:hypothetical protein